MEPVPEVSTTGDELNSPVPFGDQHRLVHYTPDWREEPLVESRYLYDPLGAGGKNRCGGVNGT
nr:hypothetical protein [Escherichia coli]